MTLIPEALTAIGNGIPLPEGDELRSLFAHDLLLPWLQRRLLAALAEQAPLPPMDDQQLLRVAAQLRLSGVEALDRWCLQQGIPLASLQANASFPQRLQAATEAIWADQVPGRFLERRSSLDQVTLTILRFDDADFAQELYFQLLEGETQFARLIEQYGSQPGQPPRALVGPVALDQLHPLLARVAERYAPGMLIPPLDLNGQVHLMRVEDLRKASLDPPMRQRMLLELRQQWLDEQLQHLLSRLAGDRTPAPSPVEDR
ncbi:MAG: peptidylprolyl isomerase [Synechococcus sp. ELA057]